MKAQAALLRELEAPLTVEEIETNPLEDGEILVKIKGVGICHTDITTAEGSIPLPLPSVLGHEGAGVIEEVGPGVTGLAVGDHVALSFGHCRECDVCQSGHPAYCEMFAALNYFGTRLDGTTTLSKGDEEVHGNYFAQSSFSSYSVAQATNAVKVDKDLPLEILGPLGCGLQTGAGAVFNVLKAQPGKGFAAFGMGGVGLGAVMAAAAIGCDPIIALDINNDRLALAKELGATHTFNPTEHHDLVWDVMQVCAPGVAYAFDAVGHGPVIRQGLELLASPGHLATVGFQGLANEITIDQGHLLLGRTLSGVIEGDADPHQMIPKLLGLYREGRFPFDRLVKTYPLDQINEAIADSNSGKVIKPVIVFD
jgi:aryl-alcohol dehydrogenase